MTLPPWGETSEIGDLERGISFKCTQGRHFTFTHQPRFKVQRLVWFTFRGGGIQSQQLLNRHATFVCRAVFVTDRQADMLKWHTGFGAENGVVVAVGNRSIDGAGEDGRSLSLGIKHTVLQADLELFWRG